MANSAQFDGSGGTYLFASLAGADLPSYPWYISAWIRPDEQASFSTVYTAVSMTRTSSFGSAGNGVALNIANRLPVAWTANGSTAVQTQGQYAVVGNPIWQSVIVNFITSSSTEVYIDGILAGSSTAATGPDLSSGSPQIRIGIQGAGTTPFKGLIANVVQGNGALSSGDKTTLSTLGASPSGVTGVRHWWPLAGNGTDSIGGTALNLSASGTVAYNAAGPAADPVPTRASYIQQVFNQATLPTDTPTVTGGTSNPLSSVSGYASIETFDVSFSTGIGSPSTWTTRLWHYIATGTPTHVAFFDDGHAVLTGSGEINDTTAGVGTGGAAMINALLSAGISVVLSLPPGYGSTDPFWTGGIPTFPTIHDQCWALFSAGSFNPLVFWLHPLVTAMNNLASRYPRRSVCGLSGGGWQTFRFACIDDRINYAIVCIRGSIASRRVTGSSDDFEQHPYPNGYTTEALYKLAVQGRRRRLYLIHAASDTCCFSKNPGLTTSSPSGSFFDYPLYDDAFLQPIRKSTGQHPDLLFKYDAGTSFHSITSDSQASCITAITSNLSTNHQILAQCAGWYPLNEGSGSTVTNLIKGGSNGSYIGSPTWNSTNLGTSPTLNGSSQDIQLGTSALAPGWPITMACWFYAGAFSTSTPQRLFNLSQTSATGGDNFVSIYLDASSPIAGLQIASANVYNNSGGIAVTPTLSLSKLYFIVAVIADNTTRRLTLYDESGLIGVYNETAPALNTSFAAPTLDRTDLGALWYNGSTAYIQWANCRVSWAALFTRALGPSDIADLWAFSLSKRGTLPPPPNWGAAATLGVG